VALPLGYGVGRIGCLLVGDDWGRPTDLPWGIAFPLGTPPTTVASIQQAFGITVDPALVLKYGNVIPVHPTQLYEIGLSALIFFLLWRLKGHLHRHGWLFMLWLVMAGLERFVVEFFRAKDDRFLGPLTVAQVISIGLVVVGVWGLGRLRGTRERVDVPKVPAKKGKPRRSRRRART